MKYKCKKCGKTITGIFKENPERGTHIVARCSCGNSGSSNWHYHIDGFDKLVRIMTDEEKDDEETANDMLENMEEDLDEVLEEENKHYEYDPIEDDSDFTEPI